MNELSKAVPGELIFGHIESVVKILAILNPTGYMSTSSGFHVSGIRGTLYINERGEPAVIYHTNEPVEFEK